MHAFRSVAVFALAIAVWPRTHVVEETCVTVIDTDRRPVLGLTEEDFAMRNGGLRLHVLDAAPATAPLSIAVAMLGFDPAERADIRAGLDAATHALAAANPAHRMSVALDRPALDGASLDAIAGAIEELRPASTDRRVVLAILRRRAGDGAVVKPARWTDAILSRRTALWTIEVGPSQTTALDKVLADAVELSGALRDVVPVTSALPAAMSRTVNLLTSQYLVSYTWPDPMLSELNIVIRHDRGVVLMPAWVGR